MSPMEQRNEKEVKGGQSETMKNTIKGALCCIEKSQKDIIKKTLQLELEVATYRRLQQEAARKGMGVEQLIASVVAELAEPNA